MKKPEITPRELPRRDLAKRTPWWASTPSPVILYNARESICKASDQPRTPHRLTELFMPWAINLENKPLRDTLKPLMLLPHTNQKSLALKTSLKLYMHRMDQTVVALFKSTWCFKIICLLFRRKTCWKAHVWMENPILQGIFQENWQQILTDKISTLDMSLARISISTLERWSKVSIATTVWRDTK